MRNTACQRTGTLLILNSLLTAIGFAQSPAAPAVRPAPIMSRWEKQVTADNAWREYPRPQLVRQQWQNLNGMWDYAITPKTAPAPTQFSGAPDRGQILVPFAVESTLSKVTKPLTPDQRLWYRRSVTVPRDWNAQRVLLHFGAVDYECSLWVNGGLVGSHTGGSDAFSFDITDYLKDGQNQVLLGVTDPTSTGEQPRGKQLLNPNSIWYTPVSGIWQTVWMEPVPKAHHIDEIRLTPEVDSGRVRVEVLLDKPVTGPTTAIRLTALDGNQTVATTITRADRVAYLPIQNPKLWSPDSPFLYNFRAELVTVNDPFAGTANDKRPRRNDAERAAYAKATVTGTATDAVTSYFAMRKIAMNPNPAGSGSAANQPVLLLNNKFVFQNGPLDQGWWPGGLLTPPSDEAMAFEIDFLKKSGFNMLRKHIKVEPDRYYYLCDKMGILVWQDMPSGFLEGQNESPGDQFEPIRRSKGVEQFELELRRMMNQLHNHPSIVTWVVHNEGWGQYDNPRLSAWVKGLDPSRTVNAVSGWNDRNAGDFYDIHTYEPEPRFPTPKPDRVVVIGEFGGIGWPIQGHLWNPEMRNWGYQTYHSAAEVEKAYRTKYAKIVDYYKNRALSAAVYTQTTDVEGEVNGLLTYDREVIKIPVETLKQIHAPLFDK